MFKWINDIAKSVPELRKTRKELETLKIHHEALLESYEELSKRAFELANPWRLRTPGHDLCVEIGATTYAYYRMNGDGSLNGLEKFLDSLGWAMASVSKVVKLDDDGDKKPAEYTVYAIDISEITIPDGSYVLVNMKDRLDCLILSEAEFHNRYMVIG